MLENYYRELVHFLNAKLGNRQVAEDVVHDAYVRILERSSDTPIHQPRAFLYRTALNLVVGTDTSAAYDAGTGTLTVSVNYPVSKLNQIMPFLVLPGIGTVPNLPTHLTARSSLQF